MESMLYQGHRFLGGIKYFFDGRESVEDKPCCGRTCTSRTDENVTKVRDLVRSYRRLKVKMTSSVLNLNCQTVHDSEKGFIVSGQRLRTLGCCITTMLPVTLPSPWTNFWPKKVFQWFRSHHTCLTVLESGRVNLLELSGPVQACNGTALYMISLVMRNWYEPCMNWSKFKQSWES